MPRCGSAARRMSRCAAASRRALLPGAADIEFGQPGVGQAHDQSQFGDGVGLTDMALVDAKAQKPFARVRHVLVAQVAGQRQHVSGEGSRKWCPTGARAFFLRLRAHCGSLSRSTSILPVARPLIRSGFDRAQVPPDRLI